MPEGKTPGSRFKFLWFEVTFTPDDPKWYKILLIVLALSVLVLIVYNLKTWVAPAIILDKTSYFKLSALINLIKGKSP